MKLPRAIIYAIHAALELANAEPDRPVPCCKLAEHGHLPERFLLQIMNTLVKHEVVCSTRGAAGGYYLSRKPGAISLLDIVEAFDNPLRPTVPDYEGLSPIIRHTLLSTLEHSAAIAREKLQRLTLADLM